MNTFLLLAGRSRRFWPLQEKTLFSVCGKTLLEHQVERLRRGGCERIILVGGAHNLVEASALFSGLETVQQEDLDLGMRGAVLSILKQYGSDPLMIVSGNDVIEPEAYASLLASKGDGAILAKTVDRYFPGGYLSTEGDKITGIVEKPGKGNEPSNLVNIVAHVHRKPDALLAALQNVDTSSDDGYEQALAALFADLSYNAVSYDGDWHPVKYPWHILNVAENILSEISEQKINPSAEVHPSAEIVGNVIIDAGARIMHNAVVRGPAYIGKNTIVANNALVRDASIGDNCVVGFCTEIKGSVLQDNVWTHMNYIGDSIVGNNVSFGGGAITGNLRLDGAEVQSMIGDEKIATGRVKLGCAIGDDCRIGVHTHTNPGLFIGRGSFISSGVSVEGHIEDRRFVRMKNGQLDIRENTADLSTDDDREVFRKKL